MSEAEVMGEEYRKTRDFYVEKIRREGNENLADTLETTTAQKLANEDYIDGIATLHPEFEAELTSLHDEIKELQQEGEEAHDWTKYFTHPNNQQQKGFQPKTLADDIEKDYHFKKLRDSEEIYVFKDGYYQTKGQQIIEEECEKRLGPEFRPKHLKKVKAFIEARNYIARHNFRPPTRMINLENGIYDLEQEKLVKHDPQYNFRNKIPVKWNPDAECEAIHEFLDSIVDNEQDVKTLREIAGYCLLPDYPINKAFMLIGKGSNGKSIYLDLLKKLVGAENYVNKSLQEIEQNRFAASKLVGSLACFDDDLPSTKLTRTSTLKKLTGGSDIGAEIKYGGQFDFKNMAKFVFACNELPRTNDQSDGFYRRWILVEFPHKFKENPDPDNPREKKARPRAEVMDKITKKEELEGFLWWAINALQDVLHANEFTHAPSTEEARQKWRQYSTPLVRFIEKYVSQGTTWTEAEQKAGEEMAKHYYDYIRKDYLTEVIGDYCEAHSHSRPSTKAITRELKNFDFYMNERGQTKSEPEDKQLAVYGGLKMVHPNPEGVVGLYTYSETFRRACGRACVEEDSKQSVQPYTRSKSETVYSKVRDLIEEEGEITPGQILDRIDSSDEKIMESLDLLEHENEIYHTPDNTYRLL